MQSRPLQDCNEVSRRQRRDVSAVAAVKEEDLRIFVTEVLAGHEDQISGLTRARRADDQRGPTSET